MLPQQVLALPHLVQSSERIQIKAFSSDVTAQTNVMFVIYTYGTYLTAFVSRVAYR